MLRQQGGNLPPQWIERSAVSRRRRHRSVADALKNGGITDITIVEDWEIAYRKECFYRGIRILFELERAGKSKL